MTIHYVAKDLEFEKGEKRVTIKRLSHALCIIQQWIYSGFIYNIHYST